MEKSLATTADLTNLDAEQALLGTIMHNNGAWSRAAEVVEARHFADPVHGQLYDAIGRLIERGQIASPITLRTYAEASPELVSAGGPRYLVRLLTYAAHAVDARQYAELIRDLHLRRQLLALYHDMRIRISSDEESAVTQIERLEGSLYDLAVTGSVEEGFKPFKQTLASTVIQAEAAYKREGGLNGVATGLADLDKLLGGLRPSDLVVIAGRPSMGKTALATNIAFHASSQGQTVGFFSLEMAADQLTARIAAAESQIPGQRVGRGELSAAEFDRFIDTAMRLEALPFFIDDSAALSISALRTRARRLKRQHDVGLLVVDYLQLITSARTDGRVQEVSEISRGLKTIAKELQIPVIALSQLSRDVEKRPDKRPLLSDLRESGSIEQDADVVLFIYRESYYLERDEPIRKADEEDKKFSTRLTSWHTAMATCAGRAELIIAKQRHGPTGSVKVVFDGTATRFSNTPEQELGI